MPPFDFAQGIAASPGWSTGSGNTYPFTVKTGGATPSLGTGPSAGVGGSGAYVFAEMSGKNNGDIFTLTYDGSACTSTGGISNVTFHYHMYGSSTGELRVTDAAGQVVWTRSGERGNSWYMQPRPTYTRGHSRSSTPA